MDDQLWRLTWALPLVIFIGVLLIYWLKRMGWGGDVPSDVPAGPIVHNNTALTEHTRVLLVEVNGQSYLVFESTANLVVRPATSDVPALASYPLGGRSPAFPWRPTRRKS